MNSNARFVPLFPVASPVPPGSPTPAAPAAGVRVAPAAANPAGFHPLTAPSAAPAKAGCDAAKPTVTLQREGERITRIRIQCVCGQVIDLACEY